MARYPFVVTLDKCFLESLARWCEEDGPGVRVFSVVRKQQMDWCNRGITAFHKECLECRQFRTRGWKESCHADALHRQMVVDDDRELTGACHGHALDPARPSSQSRTRAASAGQSSQSATMHPFASYVLRAYYRSTGWNEDNLYANLTRSSNGGPASISLTHTLSNVAVLQQYWTSACLVGCTSRYPSRQTRSLRPAIP